MRPSHRASRLWLAAAMVAAFCVASVASYRPSGATDRAAALASLKQALASLDDDTLDSAARLAAYRDELTRTDALLRRALRSNPTDTAAIERLATVRWELGVLTGGPDVDAVSSLMKIAALRAPLVPEIQAELGELAYKMGRGDTAAPLLIRAAELSPSMTNRVITTMLNAGVEPSTIMATLTPTARSLLALKGSFAESGDWSGWLDAVESLLTEHPRELIVAYTDACLASNATSRLLDRMAKLERFTDRAAEAERQIAIARAYVDRGDMVAAASVARDAQTLTPADPRLLELVGQVALMAGESANAERAFRDALGALAQSGVLDSDRSRLYRSRGQALEKLGRVDEAFDEYRRAIELAPDDPWLRERFAATASRLDRQGVR